jgi:hypothetical protein
MAVNNGNTVFRMAYTPTDHLFEGGRRLARVLAIWWALAVMVLYIVGAVGNLGYAAFHFVPALWALVGGVLAIWFGAWSVGYVVRGFMGIKGRG